MLFAVISLEIYDKLHLKKAMTKEMEKRLMREKRLIDIFQEQQEQKALCLCL